MHGISMMNEFCWNKYNKKFLGKFLWTLNILRTETLSIFSVFAEKENYTKRKVWHTLYLCFYVYEATFVPLLPKILPNNSKRGRKKYLCRGILVAVLPLVLAKSGIKGAWKTFKAIISFFRGSWTETQCSGLWICSFYTIFPSQTPLTLQISLSRIFVMYFSEFFSQIGWGNLAKSV